MTPEPILTVWRTKKALGPAVDITVAVLSPLSLVIFEVMSEIIFYMEIVTLLRLLFT